MLVALGAPPAFADSAAFAPVADSYVSSASPGSNYGGALALKLDASPLERAYLRFDVQLPAGATIAGAVLKLYTTSASSVGYQAYAVSDNGWGETTLTYDNAPPFGVHLGDSGAWGSSAGYVAITLPAGAIVTGLNSLGTSTASKHKLAFNSREATNKPQLVVTYTTTTAAPSPSPTPTPAPAPSGDPVVAAAGDIACAAGGTVSSTTCQQQATSGLLAGATGVVTLGDNQYETGALSDFQASFDPTWGRFLGVMHPAPGNHEYGTSGAAGYFSYFGSRAGSSGSGWYSYDIGAWHLIALNTSNDCSPVPCGAGSAQEQWLKQDLAAHANQCTLAYWHHPRFSSGPHGSLTGSSAFWSDLYAAGADVVLNGHDHDYERFAPQNPSGQLDTTKGIREFVVGTGGKSHYGISSTIANSQVHDSNTFGVLKLTLHAGGYDWRFIPITGASFTDSGTASCH